MRGSAHRPARTVIDRGIAATALLAALLPGLPAAADDFPPQVARGVVVPVGFSATLFAHTPPGVLPTSLSWAPAAAATPSDAVFHGTQLYVTAVAGNALGGTDNGVILAYADEGVAPTVIATGLDQPLGVVADAEGTLYVSETEANRGRVTALSDGDGDGTYETRRTVLGNLPNGRHQTNGLTLGPDGLLYVANGNATDDGLECGPALTPGGSEDDCPAPELQPWSGSILRVDPAWDDVDLLGDIRVDADSVPAADGLDDDSVLVARGFRNIYDVDFDPLQPWQVWTPMNGPDNPSGSEPLYAVDAGDAVVEDAGFPSCLYDAHLNAFPLPQVLGEHAHHGEPEPEDNPNRRVIDRFGPCDAAAVTRPKALFTEGHEGTSGLTFVRGTAFPARYRNDLLVAEWGSLWNLNGATVTGHKVIHVDLDEQRNVVGQREFMSGVLPIDLTFGPNGHLYVADMTGAIYDVSHLGDGVDGATDVVTVDMRSGQFVPQVVTVVRGQTVRWLNTDTTPHSVTAVSRIRLVDPRETSALDAGSEMDSAGDVAPGGSHTHTFTGPPGMYHYQSETSALDGAVMRGTIVVLPLER